MEGIFLDLPQFVLAAGAVGTAAMGIVEGFKSIKLTPIGFNELYESIDWSRPAIGRAYGSDYSKLLESLYRQNRSSGELPRILRQGVRIGMDTDNAKSMGEFLLGNGGESLSVIAGKIDQGEELDKMEKKILARFEVAADARIDAALSLAERAYSNGIRKWAFFVSLMLSLLAAFSLHWTLGDKFQSAMYINAVIVGLVAVPLAPIAKDVAKGFQAAAKAIGGKS